MQLGCIADDYTGASDVATALSRAGLRTLLLFGLPRSEAGVRDADAVVVGAKIRTAAVEVAVDVAVRAQEWLTGSGAERIYFKVCSTFDSTAEGNIGPITEALMRALDVPIGVVCPAAPEHGRTVYQGHLFVGSELLAATPMRDHPLTPMRNSSVVWLLDRQTEYAVGLVPHSCVREGADAVAGEVARLHRAGVRHAVADASTDEDLRTLAAACGGIGLVTGAAGLAPHLATPAARCAGPPAVPLPQGRAAVVAGSCSATTLAQVERARGVMPSFRVDPRRSEDLVAECTRWLDEHRTEDALMVYASAPPDERAQWAAAVVEDVLAAVARKLVERGVRRLVVAGGETSAAVVEAIGVTACSLGHEEAPGVPWLFPGRGPALLLKSGNFGDPDLFVRACGRRG